MTATLAPEGKTDTTAAAQAAARKFEKTYVCGYHASGNPQFCKGAVLNPRTGIIRCSKYDGPTRCLTCGGVEEVNENTWTCLDPHECEAGIRDKQAKNETHQQLLSIRASQIAAGNRLDASTNTIRADIRDAISRGATVLGADGEPIEEGSWLLEDSFEAPEEKAKRNTKQKVGSCRCCGEATRGGKFLPGHDAKLKSALKKTLGEGSDEEKATAWARVVEEGWDHLDGWPAAPVAA